MSHYKPYPSYKDSGVEWIGEVPEHWDIRSVKHLYDARLGKMVQPQPKSDEDVLVPYHRAQTVQWESIRYDQVESMWANPAEIEAYSLNEGDLLICEGGDVCRSSIFNRNEHETVIFQNSVHRVRPLNGNHSEWLLRLMQIVRSTGWIDVLCNKNTIVHFTSDKLASLECPHPPQDEQAQILTALRKETARIDALIAKKTRFIELLKEKRSALITHAVTKGLDPNVEMKDSGVEWLGEVPAHWEITKLKRGYTIKLGKMLQPSPKFEDDLLLPYMRASNIQPTGIEVTDINEMWFSQNEIKDLRLMSGDLLVSEGGDVGRCAIWTNELPEIYFQNSINRIRSCEQNSNFYLGYLLQSIKQSGAIDVICNKLSIAHLTAEKLNEIEILFPVPEEQSAIATFLDRETGRIDALVEKTRKSIDLLKERRSALISAAVTGKIDVRDAL